jgi:hypothetical protein
MQTRLENYEIHGEVMIWYEKVVIKSRESFEYFVTHSVYKLKHLTRSSKVFRVISFGL